MCVHLNRLVTIDTSNMLQLGNRTVEHITIIILHDDFYKVLIKPKSEGPPKDIPYGTNF